MTGLNDNYRRRILTSLQYADKLLTESLHVLAPGARPLFSGYAQDLSPSEARCVENYTAKIREQMARLLENCGIERSSPAMPSSGKIRTGLISVDLTLEDIYPEKMRGYGKMDAAAARELSWNLQEIRWLINLLLTFLSETRSTKVGGPAHMETGPGLAALLERMAQIVERHGLVEFLPALHAIVRKTQSRRFEIAVFGKVNSGKSTLINHFLGIDLLPVGAAPIDATPIRIVGGSEPKLRVTFLDRTEELPLAQLANHATEKANPANSKRVVAIEACAAAGRLLDGFAFVEMPGLGCYPDDGMEFSGACLPGSDFGWVLIDANASLDPEHFGVLRALAAADIPCAVMLTRCDSLSPSDIERVQAETRKAIARDLGSAPEVIPVSSSASWMPAVNAWFEKTMIPQVQRFRTAMIESVAGDAQSLRASLLATLEMRSNPASAGGRLGRETEEVLRRMDECLALFQQHWEKEFDRMSGWSGDILEHAASILAGASAGADQAGGLAPDLLAVTLIRATVGRCHPVLREYEELTGRVSADIDQLKAGPHAPGVISQKLPRPSALPIPVTSPLQGVTIAQPGTVTRTNPAGRARHYRKELEGKTAGGLRQMLEEYQPRCRRWFLMTMNALKESVRLQTDPLRYRSPAAASAETDEKLIADIALLRSR
jgi:hypothetical protein